MSREFSRATRVGDLVRRELALLLQREGRDHALGMVTVSSVEISRDLTYAKVYFSVLNPSRDLAAVLDTLNEGAGHLRHELSQRLRLRCVPRLQFIYDASISEGARLSELIDAAVASDERKHGKKRG